LSSENQANDPAPSPLVVGLGEALFDCFPDRTVLGGAPINVAVHAAALLGPSGEAAVPATRVGTDELGDRFFREITQRGVSVDYVQRDPERPTGRVAVTLDDGGHASYDFEKHSAWDALEFDQRLQDLAARCDAVAYGTLAQREPASRETIRAFVAAAEGALRLFDVNLRQDYYSREVLDASLRLATAVKINEEELGVVCGAVGLAEPPEPGADGQADQLIEAYGLDWLALTRGAEGTVVYAEGAKHTSPPAPFDPAPDADTVGAGDACCAGLLCGRLLGWSIPDTLELANRLGAFVAGRPGATPELPAELIPNK